MQTLMKISLVIILNITLLACNSKIEKKLVEKATCEDCYVSIFNGKSLDGWQKHGEEKWYVENGELICESGSKAEYGYLSTLKYYDNFELSLEFKQESNGNSGVFFAQRLMERRLAVGKWK